MTTPLEQLRIAACVVISLAAICIVATVFDADCRNVAVPATLTLWVLLVGAVFATGISPGLLMSAVAGSAWVACTFVYRSDSPAFRGISFLVGLFQVITSLLIVERSSYSKRQLFIVICTILFSAIGLLFVVPSASGDGWEPLEKVNIERLGKIAVAFIFGIIVPTAFCYISRDGSLPRRHIVE